MRIVLTGGGTGGHIYPLTAFAAYLKKVEPTAEILYIGSKRGMEAKIITPLGIPFESLDIQGIRRSLSPQNIKTAWELVHSRAAAKKLLRDFKPDLVLGTGGYVAGPVMLAALSLGFPTVIHEQNLMPGLTNKSLGKRVDKVALSFKAAAAYFPSGKTVFTGNPRAQEVADLPESRALEALGLTSQLPTVVIFGGSGGAQTINEALIAALPKLAEKDYQLVYASGERYYKAHEALFERYNSNKIAIRPYIPNMSEVLKAASLYLGRSGATTLSEVTALGLPSIFIPSPNVTGDQQTKNAQELEKAGAALLIKDSELTATRLFQSISQILENAVKYREMQAASLAQGVPDASQRLYTLVVELINGR